MAGARTKLEPWGNGYVADASNVLYCWTRCLHRRLGFYTAVCKLEAGCDGLNRSKHLGIAQKLGLPGDGPAGIEHWFVALFQDEARKPDNHPALLQRLWRENDNGIAFHASYTTIGMNCPLVLGQGTFVMLEGGFASPNIVRTECLRLFCHVLLAAKYHVASVWTFNVPGADEEHALVVRSEKGLADMETTAEIADGFTNVYFLNHTIPSIRYKHTDGLAVIRIPTQSGQSAVRPFAEVREGQFLALLQNEDKLRQTVNHDLYRLVTGDGLYSERDEDLGEAVPAAVQNEDGPEAFSMAHSPLGTYSAERPPSDPQTMLMTQEERALEEVADYAEPGAMDTTGTGQGASVFSAIPSPTVSGAVTTSPDEPVAKKRQTGHIDVSVDSDSD